MYDFVDQIIQFRTSYLRAVARASVDLPFRERLTNPHNDPLKILKEDCGYHGTWDMTLVLRDDPDKGPRVDPAAGAIVSQPHGEESLTIFIPQKPELPPTQLMDALAVFYYDANRWLLQDKRETYKTRTPQPRPVPVPPTEARPTEGSSVDMLPHRPQHSRFDLGDSVSTFLSFTTAIFSAVALAWNNPRFMQLLTHATPRQTIALLHKWIGYNYPWGIQPKVRIDEAAHYDVNASDPRWTIKLPQLTLILPWMTGAISRREETDWNQRNPGTAIMGLALYNTDGCSYPFTCDDGWSPFDT